MRPWISRRQFLAALAAAPGAKSLERPGAESAYVPSPATAGTIDRRALVRRHNPLLRRLDPLSPLSVGNGEFAFTADITGLQTFPAAYAQDMPLCTMAQWGWHSKPPPDGVDPAALRLTRFEMHGRRVGYPVDAKGQEPLFNWLRENPHRLHLGRIGLRLKSGGGREVQAADLADIEQQLDLWTGALVSRFRLEDTPVTVRTAVHPTLDQLAVSIDSELIRKGRLAVMFAFSYGSPTMQAIDDGQPDRHESCLIRQAADRFEIRRRLDRDEYSLSLAWENSGSLEAADRHLFFWTPRKGARILRFSAAFSRKSPPGRLPTTGETFSAAEAHWDRFWTQGGAIELAGSRDPRAQELERRIVLSQYLTAIQCSGSLPPQETGLTVNSWYGKFHLEMHWWHAVHFALWNRLPMLERSLGWYFSVLPAARALARTQGFAGARWPKMTAPEGLDSPSPIGPLLIWQQPHPIFYAELCYLARRERSILEKYRPLVLETAEFMASFAHLDQATQRYVLGPPLIPAQENHPPRETWNPTFELSYWAFGLRTAQAWRARLEIEPNPEWDRIVRDLAPLPVKEGVYLAHENCPRTYSERNFDHPSMLGALGMLPGDGVDRETMRRTLRKVMSEWQWERTWGWDYPLAALTAARLGEPEIAVDALLMGTPKNRYLPNGHNWQRPNLPCYLPGNGGLLYAVAMMAAGWPGAPAVRAPGFPGSGAWNVRWEKLSPAPI